MKQYVKRIKEVLRGLNDEVLDKTEWMSEDEYRRKRGKSEYILSTSHKYEWVDYQEEYEEVCNEKQVLSGKIVDIGVLEEEGTGEELRWFIVETTVIDKEVAFSCLAIGHNARHLGELKVGQYVELEGYLVLEMMAKNESNLWFNVDTIDYKPTEMIRL